MKLSINIKNGEVEIILRKKSAEIDRMSFLDKHNLTEKLLVLIDELLKRNKLEISDVENVHVESDMTDSFTTARIAKVTANIANQMKDERGI